MGTGIRTGHHGAWRQDRHGTPASRGAPRLGWGSPKDPGGSGTRAVWADRRCGQGGRAAATPESQGLGVRPGLRGGLSPGPPASASVRIRGRGRQACPRLVLRPPAAAQSLAVLQQRLPTLPGARRARGGLPIWKFASGPGGHRGPRGGLQGAPRPHFTAGLAQPGEDRDRPLVAPLTRGSLWTLSCLLGGPPSLLGPRRVPSRPPGRISSWRKVRTLGGLRTPTSTHTTSKPGPSGRPPACLPSPLLLHKDVVIAA